MSLDCLLSIWYLVEPRRVGRAVWQLRRLLITRSHPCPSHRGSGGWCYSLAPMVLTLLVELYSIWYESIPVLWGGVRAICFTTSATVNRSDIVASPLDRNMWIFEDAVSGPGLFLDAYALPRQGSHTHELAAMCICSFETFTDDSCVGVCRINVRLSLLSR